MGQELAQVLCPECGVPGESDPQLSRCQCGKCGNAFFLRRCSACARVSYVDGLQGFRMPWPCTWCGQYSHGFSPNRDPAAASAAELAAELARHGLPHPVAPAGAPDSAVPVPAISPRAEVAPAPGRAALPGRAGRQPVRRAALLMALAGACAAGAFVLVAAGSPRAASMTARQGDSITRDVRVTASRVGVIDLSGAPGQLTIVSTDSSRLVLSGQLHGAGSAPALETRFDRARDVLAVSVRCAPGSPCTENLRLAVPAGTGAAVRQPSGRIVVSGLSGPLSIAAANVDVSATGLRSPDLTAVITSGHLSASFTVPPRRLSITLASAQATLRLPGQVAYRVAAEVRSGFIRVAIPQGGNAPRTVTARIDSGELELLPS